MDIEIDTPLSEHEVTEQLITFLRGRSEHGQRKYGVALKPFDSRNSLMDALEEVTDLAQYIQKRVMENEAIADLCAEAKEFVAFTGEPSGYALYDKLDATERLLRADCERSVPVDHIGDANKKVVEYTWEQRETLAERIAIRRRGGES